MSSSLFGIYYHPTTSAQQQAAIFVSHSETGEQILQRL